MRKSICLVVLIHFYISCDKMAEIKINSPPSQFEFECGIVVIEANSTKGILYSVEQTFELNQEVIIYPKNLLVIYLGENVTYSLWKNDKDSYFLNEENKIESDSIRLKGKSRLVVEFGLDRMAEEGDIITIKANEYLKCKEMWVLSEPIQLIVKEIH